MAIFWLICGAIFGAAGIYCLRTPPFLFRHSPNPGILLLGLGTIYALIPIGVIRRTKWGYYGGLILSVLMIPGIPIGTILGIITIKAYVDAKMAFDVL